METTSADSVCNQSFATVSVNLQEGEAMEDIAPFQDYYMAAFNASKLDESPLGGKELWLPTQQPQHHSLASSKGLLEDDDVSHLSGWSFRGQQRAAGAGDDDDYSITSSIFSNDDKDKMDDDDDDDLETIDSVDSAADQDGTADKQDDDLETIDGDMFPAATVPQTSLVSTPVGFNTARTTTPPGQGGTAATLITLDTMGDSSNNTSSTHTNHQQRVGFGTMPLQAPWRGGNNLQGFSFQV